MKADEIRITWGRRKLLVQIGLHPGESFDDVSPALRKLLDALAVAGYVERRAAKGLASGWAYGWFLKGKAYSTLSQPVNPYNRRQDEVFRRILGSERIAYWPPIGSPDLLLQVMKKKKWIEVSETDKACNVTEAGHKLLEEAVKLRRRCTKILQDQRLGEA